MGVQKSIKFYLNYARTEKNRVSFTVPSMGGFESTPEEHQMLSQTDKKKTNFIRSALLQSVKEASNSNLFNRPRTM
jgi:hypothetical protein